MELRERDLDPLGEFSSRAGLEGNCVGYAATRMRAWMTCHVIMTLQGLLPSEFPTSEGTPEDVPA